MVDNIWREQQFGEILLPLPLGVSHCITRDAEHGMQSRVVGCLVRNHLPRASPVRLPRTGY